MTFKVFKTVIHPIQVPNGKYCWDFSSGTICKFFSNDGGHRTCDLNFYGQKDTDSGVLKSQDCDNLKELSHGT